MARGGWVGVLVVLVAGAGQADDLDRYVTEQLKKQQVPGASVVVVRRGQVLKAQGYGLMDVERGVRATAETVYEMGSISKSFTAMAVLLLVDRGALALDDSLGARLPEVPEAWRPVTVRQLLNHTSGIPDYEAVMGWDHYRYPMSLGEVVAVVEKKPLDFPPGTRWSYSNTGYYLLSVLVEKASGQPLARFLDTQVLQPAGLRHIRTSEPADLIPHRAAGYELKEGVLHNRDAIQPSATLGAGMLVSTASDLARWAGFLQKRPLLSEAGYQVLWGDVALPDGSHTGYGAGWFIDTMSGHRALSHSGGTPGFTCNLLLLPDDDLVVVAMLNSVSANPVPFTNHLARMLVPALRPVELKEQDPAVSGPVLDFLRHRGDPEPYLAPLSARMAKELEPYWKPWLDVARARGLPSTATLVGHPDVRRYVLRVRYPSSVRLVEVSFDLEGKIDQLSVEEE